MCKKIVILITLLVIFSFISTTVVFADGGRLKSEVEYRDHHPLRYFGYALYAIGTTIDTLVARPIQYIVTMPKLNCFFGAQPANVDYYDDVSDRAY